jgi:hypothetical protein
MSSNACIHVLLVDELQCMHMTTSAENRRGRRRETLDVHVTGIMCVKRSAHSRPGVAIHRGSAATGGSGVACVCAGGHVSHGPYVSWLACGMRESDAVP